MKLAIVPIELRDANEFVRIHHRHHAPLWRCKFNLAVVDDQGIVHGVAQVGKPKARRLDDGFTLEVNRTATDGTKNANSMLYAASWRAAQALGYKRLVTYTLASESGASLRGAGWRLIGEVGGGSWSRPNRPRLDNHPLQTKLRWEAQ